MNDNKAINIKVICSKCGHVIESDTCGVWPSDITVNVAPHDCNKIEQAFIIKNVQEYFTKMFPYPVHCYIPGGEPDMIHVTVREVPDDKYDIVQNSIFDAVEVLFPAREKIMIPIILIKENKDEI